MVNYSDGKIYKIYNNKDDEIYIGSTCCSLSTRMSKHRYRAKEDRSKVHRLYVKMNAKKIMKQNSKNTEKTTISKIKKKRNKKQKNIMRKTQKRKRRWIDNII